MENNNDDMNISDDNIIISENINLKNKISKLITERSSIEMKAKEIIKDNDDLSVENEILRQKIDSLQNVIKSNITNLTNEEKNNNNKNNIIQKFIEENNNLKLTNDKLMKEKENYLRIISSQNQTNNNNNNHIKEIILYKKEISNLKEEINKERKKVNEKDILIQKLNQKIKSLNEDIDTNNKLILYNSNNSNNYNNSELILKYENKINEMKKLEEDNKNKFNKEKYELELKLKEALTINNNLK